MTFSVADFSFKKMFNYADWKLLLFLMFFLNVKLEVKLIAIIVIYLLRFNFKFGFSLKKSRLPPFYLLVVCIAFIGLLTNVNFSVPHYLAIFFIGLCFWLLCILAIHQVKLAVENNEVQTLHHTVWLFFAINAIISFFNIALIVHETGAINPYTFQGEYQKYFIGTGDYIMGITFDTSTTNAVLCAFGMIYFLTRNNIVMSLINMAVLLLTGSNFVNLALLMVLALLFFFRSSKNQKSVILICIMFLVIFMAKISPQNDNYVTASIADWYHPPVPRAALKNGSLTPVNLTPEEVREKIAHHYLDSVYASRLYVGKGIVRPIQPLSVTHVPLQTEKGRIIIKGPDINTPPYQTPTDTTAEERQLLAFIGLHKKGLPLSSETVFKLSRPGKVTSFLQTANFFWQHPAKLIAGKGIGNFSSKLAFKATGLGFQGSFPAKLVYIGHDFLVNHLDVYLNFFSKSSGLHSLTNSPYSVYDQMVAEYGLLGIAAFVIFYLGFFAKNIKQLTYGLPILVLMLPVFFIDYWFEQLSVMIFFELLLLLNIKETSYLKPVNYGLK